MVPSVAPSAPASGASTTTTSLPRGSRPCISQPESATIGGFDLGEALRAGLHENARDLAAGRRHHAVGGQQASCDEGATVDCLLSGQVSCP